MTLRIKQSTRYQGKDWWEWSVWLEGTKPELNGVDHVVYTLHATFPDPVRTVKTRQNGFRLDSAGWGEFQIFLEIVQRNGKHTKRNHWLELTYPKDSPATAQPASKPAAPRRAGGKGPTPKAVPVSTETKAPQTVYISSGAADAEFARKLREQLANSGVKILAEDVPVGVPFAQAMRKAIEGADATVFVVSGPPNLWSKLEMDFAKGRKNKTVIPVLVGKSTQVPQPLAELHNVRVDSDQDVHSATSEILKATAQFTK